MTRLRIRKLAFAAMHPSCWSAASRGVFPSVEHWDALRGLRPDLVLDVGANRGQFALLMRTLHRSVPVVSFEPIPAEATLFRRIFAADAQVTLQEMALGEQAGTATIHLSSRADSSSMLPIGELQAKLFPATAEVGTLKVRVLRLDDLLEIWSHHRRILLKLDVQGFELSVLRGAVEALKYCAYVYAECSEVPLYVGQALTPEVQGFLEGQGFRRAGRFNESHADGRLVQADHLYERR